MKKSEKRPDFYSEIEHKNIFQSSIMGVFSHEFLDATNSTIKDTLFEPSFVKGYSFNLLFVCVCLCVKIGTWTPKASPGNR